MKIVLITGALFLALQHSLSAQQVQESAVPKAVLTSFQQHFKGIPATSWGKEKNGDYEVEFVRDKREGSAVFRPEGALVQTESKIEKKYVPETALIYITKHYAGYEVFQAFEIVAPNGRLIYETGIQKDSVKKSLTFNSLGIFVKEEKE